MTHPELVTLIVANIPCSDQIVWTVINEERVEFGWRGHKLRVMCDLMRCVELETGLEVGSDLAMMFRHFLETAAKQEGIGKNI